MNERGETFLSEAVICALIVVAIVVCLVLRRELPSSYQEYTLGLAGMLVVRRGLKGVTEMVIERGRISAGTKVTKGEP